VVALIVPSSLKPSLALIPWQQFVDTIDGMLRDA
jgi:hypothetical protein